jgi:hypothetical protein
MPVPGLDVMQADITRLCVPDAAQRERMHGGPFMYAMVRARSGAAPGTHAST